MEVLIEIIQRCDIANIIATLICFYLYDLRMEKRFEKIDERFEKIDQRFEKMLADSNNRFDRLLEDSNSKFQRIEDRFIKIDERFERFELNIRCEINNIHKDLKELRVSVNRLEGYFYHSPYKPVNEQIKKVE